ncbi:Probable serine/threonine-protein kinase DDB_G0276461 [Linum perenne]
MWKFKAFTQKEPVGLEGRYIDVGNLKIQVKHAIAEGGFSRVYLAQDAVHLSKQYALKHMICSDEESLELVMKEISVMKSLKGHPNVVMLSGHTILDTGRTKEALLVLEFCEKSLVSVLEGRGAGYFEEKQALSIFRDVCNAVYAMHCQSPPIAHRDLKAENLLLGPDGLWKLCDFGSTSTNHKRFEKPEEMGIEEDNIRKHTTPAYRAPEMWDLYRRDRISEKVDIWALGCLLFRICYLKSAFDGESKLQVLNGNYRIPESPKYSLAVTDLIRDMLQASPEDRPDITQVWFRVNQLLPANLQKSLPDGPPEAQSHGTHEGFLKQPNKSSPMPRRSPPAPPSSGSGGRSGQQVGGAFWSTQHAKESLVVEDNVKPKFDEEPSFSASHKERIRPESAKTETAQNHGSKSNTQGKTHMLQNDTSKDFEMNFTNKPRDHGVQQPKVLNAENTTLFRDEAFNNFVAEFDNKVNSNASKKSSQGDGLEAEVERLKEQVKQAKLEKAEMTSKFEKLSAICRSQRQEINELKHSLAARTPSPNKSAESPASQLSAVTPEQKFERGAKTPEQSSWQAFADEQQASAASSTPPQSVRTKSGQKQNEGASDTWGFEGHGFRAVPSSAGGQQSSTYNSSGRRNSVDSQSNAQPAGWAGF